MQKLTRDTLYSLERYAQIRPEFRARVLEHKKNRQVDLGPHARLYFEDTLTVHYQVQEMLRVERIFEAAGIEEEIATYNPLIPDGQNWKATFMLEYHDPVERAAALAKLIGVEDRVWMQVGAGARIYAIADEDLDRENDTKTSSVHFLRFELTPEQVVAAKAGAPVSAGVDHPAYQSQLLLPEPVRAALQADLA
ncbi:MAG TPA: DUF3501 family protein [Acidiferrobacteraceae bacterium]|nr:DUF3501 family protein [Acidiferrobacteraceae bacterium]